MPHHKEFVITLLWNQWYWQQCFFWVLWNYLWRIWCRPKLEWSKCCPVSYDQHQNDWRWNIFEKRYPVILHEFSIRHGSGGVGEHSGGNRIIRDIKFTIAKLEVSCVKERRSIAPFGLSGGGPGLRGSNYWCRKLISSNSQQKISLGGKCSLNVNKGDRIIIMTPGGGGYGSKKVIKY